MEVVIGLIGAKRAGKTTAYDAIKEVVDVVEITLAKKLKDVCADVTKVPRNAFDSHKLKEVELEEPVFLTAAIIQDTFGAYGLSPDFDKYIRPHIGQLLTTPRQIAQYIGSEVLRNYQDDIHCQHAVSDSLAEIGVVTDLRFPNEFRYFEKSVPKFLPIYIQNTGAEIEAAKDTHVSEAYLQTLAKAAKITISNNGSIKDFQQNVRNTIKELLNGP